MTATCVVCKHIHTLLVIYTFLISYPEYNQKKKKKDQKDEI